MKKLDAAGNRILAFAITSNRLYNYQFDCANKYELRRYLKLAEKETNILAILRIKLKKQPVKTA